MWILSGKGKRCDPAEIARYSCPLSHSIARLERTNPLKEGESSDSEARPTPDLQLSAFFHLLIGYQAQAGDTDIFRMHLLDQSPEGSGDLNQIHFHTSTKYFYLCSHQSKIMPSNP